MMQTTDLGYSNDGSERRRLNAPSTFSEEVQTSCPAAWPQAQISELLDFRQAHKPELGPQRVKRTRLIPLSRRSPEENRRGSGRRPLFLARRDLMIEGRLNQNLAV